MKTLPKQILIALTVLGMGSVSLAARADDNGGHDGHDWHQDGGHGHGHGRGGNMGERMAHFQARLHDRLKLTAAQEPAWNAYLAATKPQAPAAGAAHQDRGADWKTFAALPAPQKMEKMLDMQKKHEAMQEHHLAALKTFYATLTPEQQKTFDHSLMMGMHHHRHGHEHGRHHHWN